MSPVIAMCRRVAEKLFLRFPERNHVIGNALVAIGFVFALHFAGTESASVIVNGDGGEIGSGVNTNLLFSVGLPGGKPTCRHARLFNKTVPQLLHLFETKTQA